MRLKHRHHIWLYPLRATWDRERAESSWWLWGPSDVFDQHLWDDWDGPWGLTPLGIYNTIRIKVLHLRPKVLIVGITER